jgi:cytoskeletal protein CcmA (bactofilin family)
MFGNKKENAGSSSSTTIITECMNIEGDINGCGTIHIDGVINGNIDVEKSIIVGEKGKITGTIKSKHVLVSGTIEGHVLCDTLEVTKSGLISSKIEAKNITSDGKLEATVLAENSISITDNGIVTSKKMKSKRISVSGFVSGNVIATELLEVNKNGQTKGEMVVKKIKVAEGGLVLGTMLTYEESNSVRKVSADPVLKEKNDPNVKKGKQ